MAPQGDVQPRQTGEEQRFSHPAGLSWVGCPWHWWYGVSIPMKVQKPGKEDGEPWECFQAEKMGYITAATLTPGAGCRITEGPHGSLALESWPVNG